MRVPKDDLCITGGHSKIFEQRGSGVPDRVKADLPDAVAVTDADERAYEVAWLDRPAGPGREHQAGVGPSGSELDSVGILLFRASGKRTAGKAERGQVCAAVFPGTRLSSSRPPRQWRSLPVASVAIGYADH